MGVKSGLKDVCRVLEIPFVTSNKLTSSIDEISDEPGLTFAKLDALSESEDTKDLWQKFHKLEEENKEIFRLARAFEGIPRNSGVHASGILVTPMPVTDMFPVRYKDGTAIALYTGPQLEHFQAVKYDILGLKNISIIQKAINNIDDIANIEELYKKADITDENVWKYISSKNTEGVFQIESDMMKGIIDVIKPTCFDDLGAINALGRPGPVSQAMHINYGKRKAGEEPISYPIRGCNDILDSTYGTIAYQEQLMLISKRIAGFDDMQADSLMRKTVAKKKKAMMPMLIRCHIYGKKNCVGPENWEQDEHAPWYDPESKYGNEIEGAIARGYTEKEVLDYFRAIERFSEYCFNKSHSCSYAFIGFITAWLKYYYPVQYMAALLTMVDDDKKSFYVKKINEMGISVQVPNINISKEDFTPDSKHGEILYGLSAIKGIGNTSIPDILANAPYSSLEDAIKRAPKKSFNKRVAEGLIKAGAFDWENTNRVELLNKLHEIRKDKVKIDGKNVIAFDDPLLWDKSMCIKFEDETIGTHVTYHNWWEELDSGETATFDAKIKLVREHRQKNGKLMAFVTLTDESINLDIDCCVFAKQYGPLNTLFFNREGYYLTVNGKKSDKGSFIINEAQPLAKTA